VSRLATTTFREEHVAILPPARENRAGQGVRESLRRPEVRESLLAYSETILLDGAPVGAWGVFPMWPGVGTAWAWVSAPLAPRAVSLVRLARDRIAYAHQELALARIQAEVSSELPSGVRFAQLVGFEVEGLLRAYGTRGEDYWMLASVPRGTGA
jgi:hypothetical protein